jgi:hypothetical protein
LFRIPGNGPGTVKAWFTVALLSGRRRENGLPWFFFAGNLQGFAGGRVVFAPNPGFPLQIAALSDGRQRPAPFLRGAKSEQKFSRICAARNRGDATTGYANREDRDRQRVTETD